MANLVWEAFIKIADDKQKKALWLESIQNALETEYLDFELTELITIETKEDFVARTEDIFSSGQKIIFQFLTRFLSVIDKKSLLIFDEPETHLHPNITGRLLRAINTILVRWRSFCILSTHSPIIVQEIPSRYIRIFDRHKNTPSVRRPLIECFGENLSNISNSIFEADQEKEIYKTELERIAENYTLEEIEALFSGRLSMNAQLYLQTLNLRINDGEL
jgi:predicted ATPase